MIYPPHCVGDTKHRNRTHAVKQEIHKTFNNGSLGSRIDEERSEMRYLV